jgi:hypothetical protein
VSVEQSTTMTTPVKTFGDYVACFDSIPEDESMRRHFIKTCGWTEAQFRKIANYAWFSAEISIWKDGVQLTEEYLGACCYKKSSDFYTEFAGDYWSDKVHTCAKTIGDPQLLAMVDAWRNELRERDLAFHRAREARAAKNAAKTHPHNALPT